MSAHQTPWTIIWCALACLVIPAPARAQLLDVTAFPVQDLAFGEMLPGSAELVTTDDAARRASFDIQGIGSYTLAFTLPDVMVNAAGATLPVTFGATDGLLEYGLDVGFALLPGETFDPRVPRTVLIPSAAGGARVHLGGTATAAATQMPGDYTATITLQIAPIL